MNKRTHLIALTIVLLIAIIEGVLLLYPSHASNLNISTGKADYKINQDRGLAKKTLEQEHAVTQVAQSGILPPNNPSKSLVPNPAFTSQCSYNQNDNATQCNNLIVNDINSARSTLESMSGLNLNVSAYESLSTPEQIFVITNLERVQRGLPPAVALTTQLNSVASTGIADSTDPILNGWTLTGGTQVYSWGSNWAEGTINPLGSDYYWVYDDGYPSDNGDCQTANAPGCWGHRDNILGTFISSSECSNNPSLYMGTANSNSQYDEIFAGGCGPAPSDEIFTWSQALAILGSSTTVPPPSIPTNVSATASNSTSVTVKWTASTDTGGPGLAGYYIYRNGTMIGNSTTTSYVDNTVAASTTYNYTVAAYDSDNPPNVSAQSPSASVTTPASSPVLTTVTGTVINASTNQPISGAYVTTGIHATANGAATTYTNSKGQYTLTNLIPNTSHSFYYTAGGYNEYTTSETYPAETAVLNVSMTPILNTTTVQGTVYNATTHAPIAGVYVTTGVYGTSNGAATATTNATGQYTLTNLVPNKTHDFYFTANGYDAYSTSETWPIGVYTLNANLTPL